MIQLMDHQREGIAFLLERQAGLLAFEQGLGKTLVAIEAFRRLYSKGEAGLALIICPNSLKRNWAAEFARFAPELPVVIAEGTPRARRAQLARVRGPVVIVSYETARAEVTALLAVVGRAETALILDESHAVKNRESLTSVAAAHLAPRCRYRWLLSGTPVTNSPADLHTQIGIVEPHSRPLGNLDSFLAEVAGGAPVRMEELQRRIGRYVLRRTKDQCLDLPDKTFVDIRVELPPWQREMYDAIRDGMVAELRAMSGEQYRAFVSTALVRLTRLAQVASNPQLIVPSETRVPGKHLELGYVLDEVLSEPNRKVILWCQYVETIRTLLERYAALKPVAIYGGTPAADRQGIADRFQRDPETRLLVANPAAAGTGFTLTASNCAIYETLSWRYDFYAQSQDRNHRIGQSQPVTYVRLIASDTIEEAMVRALERKSQLARSLLGDPDAGPALFDMSREEMCELLLNNKLPDGR